MKIDIKTNVPQQMTCDEIDNFVTAHIGGIRHTLEEPEGGFPAPFPLSDDSDIPQSIVMTDGIYTDTLALLRSRGFDVTTPKEYVRLDICEEQVKAALLLSDKDGDGKVEINDVTSVKFENNSTIRDLSVLSQIPNLKSLPGSTNNGTWIGGISGYTLLERLGSKYLTMGFEHYFYSGFNSLPRLILPSYAGCNNGYGSENYGGYPKCAVIDFGPDCKSIGARDNFSVPGVLVLRRTESVTEKASVKTDYYRKIFVPETMLASYKEHSVWGTLSDRIFPIGGPTWVSEYGSSDPYADLTAEERSWYEDLFPDLYKDYVAPTED